jgi:hypothetical protein
MPGGLPAKAQAFTGPPHAALKASIDGESAVPLARLAGIDSPPSPAWGMGNALPLPRRKMDEVSNPGWTRLSAGGEDFAGFTNCGSGAINAV